MTTAGLHEIRNAVANLPALPRSVPKLMEIIDDPSTTTEDVEEAIRYDPGLTANILKLANSARFGFQRAIGSISEAVVRLGIREVKKITMTASVGCLMDKPLLGYGLQEGGLWEHTIAVAIGAEELLAETQLTELGDVFTPALLHDVGKLVIARFLQGRDEEVDDALAAGLPFDQIERNLVGFDHSQVGAMILSSWSLPKEFVTAARWHHNPEGVASLDPLVDLVHVADGLAMMTGFNAGIEGLSYSLSESATERLGLDEEAIESAATRMLLRVREMTEAPENEEAEA